MLSQLMEMEDGLAEDLNLRLAAADALLCRGRGEMLF